MVIDQQTKRRIIDLSSNEHQTIRNIAKNTKKSSRDIIAILRNTAPKGKEEENDKTCGKDTRELNQGTAQENNHLPLNTKAYTLFSEGRKPIEVAIALKLSEAEATKFHLEYLRLSHLPELPFIYEKLRGPQGISFFLNLCKLALAERMTAKNVLNFLKMANDCRLYDIENSQRKSK